MKTSLSEISTVNATFAEDVAAYAAAGFDAIGIWESKLPDDDVANLALLAEHGLTVSNCVPLVPSFLPVGIPGLEGPSDLDERYAALDASVRRLAAYQPECLVCITGAAGALSERAAHELVVDRLQQLATVAREAGTRLGFEPLHPHDREIASFVNTAAAAAALLDEAGLSDVGLLIDTFNLWDDDGAVVWLQENGARITGFHVADQPSAGHTGRLLPGENGTRTRELVDAARAGGWDGSVDVEIFSAQDDFWGLPLADATRCAHASAVALLT